MFKPLTWLIWFNLYLKSVPLYCCHVQKGILPRISFKPTWHNICGPASSLIAMWVPNKLLKYLGPLPCKILYASLNFSCLTLFSTVNHLNSLNCRGPTWDMGLRFNTTLTSVFWAVWSLVLILLGVLLTHMVQAQSKCGCIKTEANIFKIALSKNGALSARFPGSPW